MKSKTHEVCAECGQYITIANPHVIAQLPDGTVVYLHVTPCFNRYSYHHAMSYTVVLGSADAVYGGGS